MRVSVDPGDPGYVRDAAGGRYEVYLDSERITKAITADEEQGIVVRYVTDRNGFGVLDPVRNEALRETLTGRVVIVVSRGKSRDG